MDVINLNDKVRVTLTDFGASVVNKEYEDTLKRRDIKELKGGNILRTELWTLVNIFANNNTHGSPIAFRDLIKESSISEPRIIDL